MTDLADARRRMQQSVLADENLLVPRLIDATGLDAAARSGISAAAERLVDSVRARGNSGLMESFLAEYGLATGEGLALMSLAEALLRIPDVATVDALIDDKIGGKDWKSHFGQSTSSLVNFSSRALHLTAQVLGGPTGDLGASVDAVVRRLGEPVIRRAVGQAMRILGDQFVLGRTIEQALRNGAAAQRRGYRYSYDMLGEAAATAADAARYLTAYADAIGNLAATSRSLDVRQNPGISVKLSALHPRYEFAQRERVLAELVPRVTALARAARAANMGFTIDAEESYRLDLSLDVIAAVAADPELAGWRGFGVVVQAYGKRMLPLIDWLAALARDLDRQLMVRLVKGAYWDAEIKRAQVLGLAGFPVFTRKAATDVSYIAAARSLFAKPALYPQFATHNAHTASAVLHLARQAGRGPDSFEFQRLHGMGEALHDVLRQEAATNTRIYAPVGPHKDLLAYLVRRLLENGANGSFVHKIADPDTPSAEVAADPVAKLLALGDRLENPGIAAPADLFAPDRRNSAGADLTDPLQLDRLASARDAFRTTQWHAVPPRGAGTGATHPVLNPARPDDIVGTVVYASPAEIEEAVADAFLAVPAWSDRPPVERAERLEAAAGLYEANAPELYALLAREAGKTWGDAVAEVREAVDFLRYYASQGRAAPVTEARGVFACISPWNFPLAIFTGQIAAALMAGNTVLAKPAEQTPLIGYRAVELLHAAGIPAAVLQCLPGDGAVGAKILGDVRIAGVAFTGSLDTAHAIDRSMADTLVLDAPLIAETGGINVMIVDSTALAEQAVRDVLVSAFQSAGQRCSALRLLYVQDDIADHVIDMLRGAMAELTLGDPWTLATDIGPVIEAPAQQAMQAYVQGFADRGALLQQGTAPAGGHFVAPALLQVGGIADLAAEVFGPVLHVARFEPEALPDIVAAINAAGYGLTFGLHSRLSPRIAEIAAKIHVGNIYVNRNQIGAVVGSQPFGGEGLSGTGPKAGGPRYLPRFTRSPPPDLPPEQTLPGPTGEDNVLRVVPRPTLLCLGPTAGDLSHQSALATLSGTRPILPGEGDPAEFVAAGHPLDAVAYFGTDDMLKRLRVALSRRDGPIIPLLTSLADRDTLLIERHVCIDTTASGGNASLVGQAGES